MTTQPTHDRIFVSRKAQETKTAGGLVIPEVAGEKPNEGVVVATGPGKTFENGNIVPLTVKVGDRVLFSQHAGQTTKVDGADILVMREDDVLAIIEDES